MPNPDPVPPRARGTPHPLAKWLERETRIAAVTRPLRHALDQREHYTDLRGERHPLASMSAAEALLVLALLERHASTLHRGELGEHLCAPTSGRQSGRRSTGRTAGSPRSAPPNGCTKRRCTAR